MKSWVEHLWRRILPLMTTFERNPSVAFLSWMTFYHFHVFSSLNLESLHVGKIYKFTQEELRILFPPGKEPNFNKWKQIVLNLQD